MSNDPPKEPDEAEQSEEPTEQDRPNELFGRSDAAGRSDSATGSGPESGIDSGSRSNPGPTGDPNRWGGSGGDDSSIKSGLYKRLAVGGAIVLAILVFSAIAGAILAPEPPTQAIGDAPDPAEPPAAFAAENISIDRIEATGEVDVSEDLTVSGGHTEQTVLIEETGSFEQRDVRPLVRGTTDAGHEIRFREGGGLENALQDADAYVLIAPEEGLTDDEVEAVVEFTDRGGRLIMLAEPDRVQVGVGGGARIVRTDMRAVASEYGIVFGNRYLYDTADNDANFRQIFGESTGESDMGVPELELDRVVLSTATRVDSREGTVLLRTPETTKLSDGGSADAYPVAVAQTNVLAVGDTDFITEENHNVADNEQLVEYILEFSLAE